MSWPGWIAAFVTLGFGFGISLLLRTAASLRKRVQIALCLAGVAVGIIVLLLESYVLASCGLAYRDAARPGLLVLIASIGVVSPLEQLGLALAVWPLQRKTVLESSSSGILATSMAATGFGLVVALHDAWIEASLEVVLRGCCGQVALLLSAGIWGAVLGGHRSDRHRWLPLVWVLGVGVQGLMGYLTYGPWSGSPVTLVFLHGTIVLAAYFGLRHLGLASAYPTAQRRSRLSLLTDVANIEAVRAAWQHSHRPALIHWIVGGALVSFGGVMLSFALGVWVVNTIGIDISQVGESSRRALLPGVLLSLHVLLAFPISGYLVARASAADSVFEPGMGALLTIAFVTLLLSMKAPIAGVLGVVLAPLAFGLACFGAWLGLDKQRNEARTPEE